MIHSAHAGCRSGKEAESILFVYLFFQLFFDGFSESVSFGLKLICLGI